MWWSNVFNNYPFFIFLWDRIGWMDNGICVCDWGIICGFVWNNIHVLLRNISQCRIRRLVMFLGPNISALRSKLFCSFMWNWKGRIDNMIRVRDRGIFDFKKFPQIMQKYLIMSEVECFQIGLTHQVRNLHSEYLVQ